VTSKAAAAQPPNPSTLTGCPTTQKLIQKMVLPSDALLTLCFKASVMVMRGTWGVGVGGGWMEGGWRDARGDQQACFRKLEAGTLKAAPNSTPRQPRPTRPPAPPHLQHDARKRPEAHHVQRHPHGQLVEHGTDKEHQHRGPVPGGLVWFGLVWFGG